MKALISLLLVVLIAAGIYMFSIGGCTRAQVAGDQALARIDAWLGELNVKRKKISNQISVLDKAVENVRQKKVEAEVQLETYQKKIDDVNKSMAAIKEGLTQFRPHIAATSDVEINGKTFTPDRIKASVDTLVAEYDAYNKKLGGLEATVKAFQQAYDLLAAQQETASKSMASLKQKLEEIDAKKEALDGMKSAQTILGEGGSISDEFTELEKDIEDLFVAVESGMRVESEKIAERERSLEQSSKNVDKILDELKTVDERAAQLDEILGTAPPPGEDK